MSNQPTPRPWCYWIREQQSGSDWPSHADVIADDGVSVRRVGVDKSQLFKPEHAALIVLAVNQHDKLVAALRAIADDKVPCDQHHHGLPEIDVQHYHPTRRRAVVDFAKAALADVDATEGE